MDSADQVPHKPTLLTLQQEVFVFSSLMLLTCLFLPWRNDEAPSEFLSDTSPWLLFVGVLCLTPLTVRMPRVRPWVAIYATSCVMGALAFSRGTEYGAQLARFFALVTLVVSARPAVIATTDFAMKRLNSQKSEVSSHWGTALDNVHFSTQQFYSKVEEAIRAREWPGIELLRVLHTEAGLLSHKREYLRVIRQRQVFDICAATFGKDYFFTLREAEIKPPLSFATFLIFVLLLFALFGWFLNIFGFINGVSNFILLVALGFFLMWNALRMGMTRLDGLFMRLPVIGPVYETFFRRSNTYFQHDTRMVFIKLMDELVKEQVDEETSAKGIKLLSCFEHRPIFQDFYQVAEHSTERAEKK